MVTTKVDLKQLKHRDPAQRIAAIKAVARAADRRALHQLAIMTEDDPVDEVRAMAKKAGVYIRQKLGELPQAILTEDESQTAAKPVEIDVDPRAVQQAQGKLSAAAAAQMDGDMARMMKAMRKAAELNPNLRFDPYFQNLAEAATGVAGVEGVNLVFDDSVQREAVKKQHEKLKRAKSDAHHQQLDKVNSSIALFDFGMFMAVLLIGGIVLGWMQVYLAQNYVNGIEVNWERVDEAIASGNQNVNPDTGVAFYWIDGEENSMGQITFEEAEATPFYYESLTLGATPFPITLLRGVVIAVVGLIQVLVLGFTIHLVAKAMGGDGKLAYIMHRVPAFLFPRLLRAMVLFAVTLVLLYALGPDLGIWIVLGVASLNALLMVVGLFSLVSESYNISTGIGLVAVLPGILFTAGTAALVYFGLAALTVPTA